MRWRRAAVALAFLAAVATAHAQSGPRLREDATARQAAYFVRSLDNPRERREARADILDTQVLPGSIVKAVALVAALEDGVIRATTSHLCRRTVTADGQAFVCSHPDLKRALSPAEALAYSCNDFFVSLAPRLSRDTLNRTRLAAGLAPIAAGTPLAPAIVGLAGPRTSPRALVDVMARLVGAGKDKPVPMSAATRAVLLDGLRGAADYGTASALKSGGVSALAKTGTILMPSGAALGLVVALTPADRPTHGMVVAAPGGAGVDAAAIAADLLSQRTVASASAREQSGELRRDLAVAASGREGGPQAPVPAAKGPYSMCYAISTTSDPMGAYYRYEFLRPLFPDYPRPAVWPDGYYVPTSTGDEVIEKHACVVEREAMLKGQPAREQCFVINDVNFLNNADLDGTRLPARGAPNVMLATGGTQLRKDFAADAIVAWKFFTDWKDVTQTRLEGPARIAVAPYRYLCDGQLTNCVPQPGTDRRLDAQGDKLMARVVYRRIGNQESIVAVHSVNTAAGGGGVRWYEFRLDGRGTPALHQQGTYAPLAPLAPLAPSYRWMASPAIDKFGNIGIGYSFGGTPHFAGQRFAGRTPGDPLGVLGLHETVLVEGEAAQTTTLRWEDYTQTAVDPSDDCTIWYVGDYLKKDATAYSTRIGAFRLPGCTP